MVQISPQEQSNKTEYIPGSSITPFNVQAFETYYKTKAVPMRPESDRHIKDYFEFMDAQLQTANNPASLTYPLQFYDGEIPDQKALRKAVLKMARSYQQMMHARGRNDISRPQPNRDWWSNQGVEGLFEAFDTFGKHLGRAVKTLGISDEQFWKAVGE